MFNNIYKLYAPCELEKNRVDKWDHLTIIRNKMLQFWFLTIYVSWDMFWNPTFFNLRFYQSILSSFTTVSEPIDFFWFQQSYKKKYFFHAHFQRNCWLCINSMMVLIFVDFGAIVFHCFNNRILHEQFFVCAKMTNTRRIKFWIFIENELIPSVQINYQVVSMNDTNV